MKKKTDNKLKLKFEGNWIVQLDTLTDEIIVKKDSEIDESFIAENFVSAGGQNKWSRLVELEKVFPPSVFTAVWKLLGLGRNATIRLIPTTSGEFKSELEFSSSTDEHELSNEEKLVIDCLGRLQKLRG